MRSFLQREFFQKNYFFIVLGLTAVFIVLMIYYGKGRNKFYYKVDNRGKNYVKELKKIEKDCNRIKPDDRKERVDHYMRLVDMYYKGVPDIYDGEGKKLRGVEPDAHKAILYLKEAIKVGYVKGYILLAKMYHEGFHGLEPDLEKAEEIYRTILKNHPVENNNFFGLSFDDRMEAEEGLDKLMKDKHVRFVSDWLNLPMNGPNRISGEQREFANFEHNDRRNDRDIGFLGRTSTTNGGNNIYTLPIVNKAVKEKMENKLVEENVQMKIINRRKYRKQLEEINNQRNEHFGNNRRNTDDIEIDYEVPTVANPRRNDLQNVHDSTVLSTIKKSIKNLTDTTKITRTLPQTLQEVRRMITNEAENNKKEDALKALDAIERSDTALSFSDMKEVDALNLVWNRINDGVNKENFGILKNNLVNELAECIEHDKPVCSTGRFTRVIDTLNLVDKDVTIKPTHLINQEMMNKSAKIREEMYNQLSDGDKKKLETVETNAVQEDFDGKLKDRIRKTLKAEYVDTGIMSEQKFNGELSRWINMI